MMLIDANAILRYMLNDNINMALKTRGLIEKTKVHMRFEVLAEVVYVLNKVYSLPRKEIADGIEVLLSDPNIETESNEVILCGLKMFAENNIDFVDCLLYAFKAVNDFDVFTFDKKLNSMLSEISQS